MTITWLMPWLHPLGGFRGKVVEGSTLGEGQANSPALPFQAAFTMARRKSPSVTMPASWWSVPGATPRWLRNGL